MVRPGKENCKTIPPFLDFGPLWHHHIVDSPNFDVLVSPKALKAQMSSSKINFGSKICEKCNPKHFRISKISHAFLHPFFGFLDIFEIHWKMQICMLGRYRSNYAFPQLGASWGKVFRSLTSYARGRGRGQPDTGHRAPDDEQCPATNRQ